MERALELNPPTSVSQAERKYLFERVREQQEALQNRDRLLLGRDSRSQGCHDGGRELSGRRARSQRGFETATDAVGGGRKKEMVETLKSVSPAAGETGGARNAPAKLPCRGRKTSAEVMCGHETLPVRRSWNCCCCSPAARPHPGHRSTSASAAITIRSSPGSAVNRVVLLPLVNETDQPRAAFEMTDALVAELQRMGLFEVVVAPASNTPMCQGRFREGGRFDEWEMVRDRSLFPG